MFDWLSLIFKIPPNQLNPSPRIENKQFSEEFSNINPWVVELAMRNLIACCEKFNPVHAVPPDNDLEPPDWPIYIPQSVLVSVHNIIPRPVPPSWAFWIVNLLPAVARNVPLTSNLYKGPVLLIPILPLLSILIFSVGKVLPPDVPNIKLVKPFPVCSFSI